MHRACYSPRLGHRWFSSVGDAFRGPQWSVKAFLELEANEVRELKAREGSLRLEDVRVLYERSHLRLPERSELERIREDLQGVLLKCRKLQESVPQGSLAPGEASAHMPLRQDAVTEGGDATAILQHAKVTKGGAFEVPKVV